MASIHLSNGGAVLVDDADVALVERFHWYGKETGTRGVRYAQSSLSGKTVYMHRLLLNAPYGTVVDHKNGNGLDNRRSNIRIVTQSINVSNSNVTRAKSGFRGVYECKEMGSYMYELKVRGKITKRKGFAAPKEAHEAYLAKRRELLGADYVERES